jgi:hypothetical protein
MNITPAPSTAAGKLDLIPEVQFAQLRRCKVTALRNERSRGAGPPFVRLGRAVFYQQHDVLEYIRRHRVDPSKKSPTLIDGERRRSRRQSRR